jgi:O-antigen ligase
VSLHLLFFKILVLLLPTQLAKHFWFDWSYIYGIRVDYFSPTIYLTDILILFILFFWLFESKPKIPQLTRPKIAVFFFTLLLVFLNIYFSPKFYLTLYKWLKTFEFSLLALYVYKNKQKITHSITLPLLISISFVLLISLLQILSGKTIGGPAFLLGERTFSLSTPGISKLYLFHRVFLRPYATFPHPNAMAGFVLLAALLINLFEKKKSLKIVFNFISFLLILISFSQNSWLGLSVLSLLFYFKNNNSFKKIIMPLFLLFIIFSLAMPLFSLRLIENNFLTENVKGRLFLSLASEKILIGSPLFGVGLGNFISSLPEIFRSTRVFQGFWSIQPVHNIFLLLLSETGFTGFLSIICLFAILLKRSLSKTNLKLFFVLFVISITGLFDHYWLTLQQNQLLLAIALGLVF